MEEAIQQHQIIVGTLDILMSDINSFEDLFFVNDAITDYETEFHCDLRNYRKKLIELKKDYVNFFNLLKNYLGFIINK